MNYLNGLYKRLKNKIDVAEFKGCSDEEILSLESSIGVKLPSAFKEFLEVMGKDGGRFLRGSSCFIDELSELREWAEELLEEDNFTKKLSENAFVFWMHQGYQFAFFLLDGENDPQVYFYYEDRTKRDFERTGFPTLSFYGLNWIAYRIFNTVHPAPAG